MRIILFVFLFFPMLVHCGKVATERVILTTPQDDVVTVTCRLSTGALFGPAQAYRSGVIGSHDAWGRLRYDIRLYPGGNWVTVNGSCVVN